MDSIQIEVPHHIKDEGKLADWLADNLNLLRGAMDLDASKFDIRATVDDIRVTNIEMDDQTVTIFYEYDYSVYEGCRDKNYSGTEEDLLIEGHRQGRSIAFPKFKPTEKRSTYDEL